MKYPLTGGQLNNITPMRGIKFITSHLTDKRNLRDTVPAEMFGGMPVL